MVQSSWEKHFPSKKVLTTSKEKVKNKQCILPTGLM